MMSRNLSVSAVYIAEQHARGNASARQLRRSCFWLTILLLILLPVQRFILPFGLTLADVVLILVIIVAIEHYWRTVQPLVFPLVLPMWLILIASLYATAVGLRHFDSLVAIGQEVYLFVAFLALVNLWRLFSRTDFDRTMKIWCLVAVAEAIMALAAMFRIGPSFLYSKPTVDTAADYEIVRAIGVHANANAAAVYLSVAYFVALATGWPWWIRVVVAAIIYGGIVATGSNGALFSTAIATGGLAVVASILRDRHRVFLWGGVLCVAALTLILLTYLADMLTSMDRSHMVALRNPLLFMTLGRFTHSLSSRVYIMNWGWDVFRDYPWGVGPNGYATIRGSLHNDYIAFLFERGMLGFLGWIGLLAQTITRPISALRSAARPDERWRILVLLSGFSACALNSFSHELSHMRQLWLLMALLLALSYAVNEHRRPFTQQLSIPAGLDK